jgi:hypothetical protein
MLKRCMIFIAAIFIFNMFPAFVAGYEPNTYIDYTNDEVTVYGTARPESDLITCYVESPDKRIVYLGSVDVQNGEYSFKFKIESPVEGVYRGRVKTQNTFEEENFSFVYALKSGIRTCGIEYEQNVSEDMPDTVPEIKTVHVELVSIIQGLYRLTINKDNSDECVYDTQANPFFFWRASEGTFVEYNEDYTSVIFKVDPGTSGKDIRIIVGMGDGLGQVDYSVLSVAGMNAEY